MTSFRLDPFAPLDHVAREFFGTPATRAPRFMPLDLVKTEDGFTLTADLPGVSPESIGIDIDNGILTITAERTTGPAADTTGDARGDAQANGTSGRSGATWLANERFSGSYRRQISVGDTVNTEKITADYSDGVLTVTLPVAERAKTRRIAVTHSASTPETVTAAAPETVDAAPTAPAVEA
ncbi:MULTISPECIES: Hsp20/alpha crystallin family protein [Corynebacterium]|jgi:HSP20 family protein|uniref:18 kDa heat shock protein n=1 Tax=Corynebacterium provencense TaxID=1737425 RepID=A0A2Z3Z0D6_9CORY|nr:MULTISPECIES: Hsp20/alpha crystallin family protein [Corynebacterium]AWT27063.1 18 kDa heat shock protein [Corynebacterium provencense]MCI1255237.1 Hsp20/alpha crystallin family protein [Corynebacterium provencense]